MNNNKETITMPGPETEPVTKPTTTEPDTEKSAPSTNPGKENDPWKVPAPNVEPGPKA